MGNAYDIYQSDGTVLVDMLEPYYGNYPGSGYGQDTSLRKFAKETGTKVIFTEVGITGANGSDGYPTCGPDEVFDGNGYQRLKVINKLRDGLVQAHADSTIEAFLFFYPQGNDSERLLLW